MKYCNNCQKTVAPKWSWLGIVISAALLFLFVIPGIIGFLWVWRKNPTCPDCGKKNWGSPGDTMPSMATSGAPISPVVPSGGEKMSWNSSGGRKIGIGIGVFVVVMLVAAAAIGVASSPTESADDKTPKPVKTPEPIKAAESKPTKTFEQTMQKHKAKSEACMDAVNKVSDVIEYGLDNAETVSELESIYREHGMKGLVNEAEIPCQTHYNPGGLYWSVYHSDKDRMTRLGQMQLDLDLIPNEIRQFKEGLAKLNAFHREILDDCISIRSYVDYSDFVKKSQDQSLVSVYDDVEDAIWALEHWEGIDRYPAVHILIQEYDDISAEVSMCHLDNQNKYDR